MKTQRQLHHRVTRLLLAAAFAGGATILSVAGAPAAARVAGGEAAKVRAERLAYPNLKQVIIVFKTHIDLGYTDEATNVFQYYRTEMADKALSDIQENRTNGPGQQFVWTLPGWAMKTTLEGQTPERRERIWQEFKDGHIVVHALPFQTITEMLDIEDMVRSMDYSSRLCREAGLSLPRDAKMTDEPSHTWFVVTLLKHAGVEFFQIGCNPVSQLVQVPMLFWWEGPDGSRLLTMYTKDYGTSLLPPKEWPYQTWLALQVSNDNYGPPKPGEVRRTLASMRRSLPGVEIRIGRLSDFADAILAEKAEIPVVRGDMPDTWIHGPLCDPEGIKLARHTQVQLPIAETLGFQLRHWDVAVPELKPSIADRFEQELLYGEHTWGGDSRWVGTNYGYGKDWERRKRAGDFDRLEQTWVDKTALARKAAAGLVEWSADGLSRLAKSVNLGGKRIVVYNPLPQRRSGIVAVPMPAGSSVPAAVKTLDGKTPSPAWRNGPNLEFFARDVPPLGYRTYFPEYGKAEAAEPKASDGNTLENAAFKITLDPAHGAIRSLIDKKTGRECVDASSPYGFGQILHERFSSDQTDLYEKTYVRHVARSKNAPYWYWRKPGLPPADQAPYQALSLRDCKVTVLEEPGAKTARMEGAVKGRDVNYRAALEIRVEDNTPYFTVTAHVYDKPEDSWPEGLWLCFPMKADAPQFRLGRLGSIVDPKKDILPGSNLDMYTVTTGVAINDPQGYGMGLCPLDHPLVSLDSPRLWKCSPDFVPKRPWVFINFYNNEWTTNFRLWNGGTWSSSVRLWLINPGDTAESLIVNSLDARCPLMGALADGPAGTRPAAQGGLAISRKGTQMTAFGPNPDGPGTILRLWELTGQKGECRVTLPGYVRVKSVLPVDLRGRPEGAPVPVTHGAFTVQMHPFGPASFLIQEQ